MSESSPVLARVDALLKKHQPGGGETSAGPADDLPVLTEVVDLPSAAEAGLEALAAEVERRVAGRLSTELDRVLEERLAARIGDLLEQGLHGLRAELSVSVHQMVREAVARAVAQELAARSRRPE